MGLTKQESMWNSMYSKEDLYMW